MENVDAFWNELKARASSGNMRGVEELLDANPFKTGTELRQKADHAVEASKSLHEYVTNLAKDLHRRLERLREFRDRFDRLTPHEKSQAEEELRSFERDEKVLDDLRQNTRLALVESTRF